MADAPITTPPMLAIVGKKHAGKTTLVVQLSAELTRRGHRVMTLKHGSHTFNLDPAATDTYRHYHEGNAERVAMASPDKFAVVMRWERELSPEEIAARYLSDAGLVLCEGFKASDGYVVTQIVREGFKTSALPKVEIFRRAAHDEPLWSASLPNADSWRGLVSERPVPAFPGLQVDLSAPRWLDTLADWVEREYLSPAPS